MVREIVVRLSYILTFSIQDTTGRELSNGV